MLGTIDPDCVVVESHGAVYRGTARVAEWIDAWFAEGNTIEAWGITALLVPADTAAMEWRFTCTWHGARGTVVHLHLRAHPRRDAALPESPTSASTGPSRSSTTGRAPGGASSGRPAGAHGSVGLLGSPLCGFRVHVTASRPWNSGQPAAGTNNARDVHV